MQSRTSTRGAILNGLKRWHHRSPLHTGSLGREPRCGICFWLSGQMRLPTATSIMYFPTWTTQQAPTLLPRTLMSCHDGKMMVMKWRDSCNLPCKICPMKSQDLSLDKPTLLDLCNIMIAHRSPERWCCLKMCRPSNLERGQDSNRIVQEHITKRSPKDTGLPAGGCKRNAKQPEFRDVVGKTQPTHNLVKIWCSCLGCVT